VDRPGAWLLAECSLPTVSGDLCVVPCGSMWPWRLSPCGHMPNQVGEDSCAAGLLTWRGCSDASHRSAHAGGEGAKQEGIAQKGK
jgi:hypothetical protein